MSEKVINNLNIKNEKPARTLVWRMGWQCQRGKAFSPEELLFKDASLCVRHLKVPMLWRKLLKVFIRNFWEPYHLCTSR